MESYTCKNCGANFPRWDAITHRQDKGGYQLHKDSLIWHFLENPECNKANSIRRKEDREARDAEMYAYEMEMI